MGDIVKFRRIKRREEREADLVRLAKEVMGLIPGPYDNAPSEYSPSEPSS